MKDTGPLIPQVGVIGLVYHEWNSNWMTPHHVLTRLANYFRVVWMEPAHNWRDFSTQLRRWFTNPSSNTSLHPLGFHVYSPEPWYCEVHRPSWLRRFSSSRRLTKALSHLRQQGCCRFVLYLWHPRFEQALSRSSHHLSLYHIDDEYSFSKEPVPDERELRVIRTVDQVFVISPRLLQRKGGLNPNTTLMPEGVDYRSYATSKPEPQDIREVPHPRIGYTGVIKRQLDWPLMRELAHRHPRWSFVFVGPRVQLPPEANEIVNEISYQRNVYFLGAKTVTELAAYPQHFDVCIMPYRVDGYTDNIYPLKLHEYLASGRPIVGAPIRTLLDFQNVVGLASTPEQWSMELINALEMDPSDVDSINNRRRIARTHDWSEIVYRIARIVCDRLGPDMSVRLRKLQEL